jgi:hypothetical protein
MEIETHITPKKVMDILAKSGTFVTYSEAEIILSFLTNLASISLQQTKENEGRFVYPCEHG